jgi:transcriptional regulator with XRE-family HTH domain
MTKAELRAWRKRLGMSRREAAEALGLSASQWERYEMGYTRTASGNTPTPIPLALELACLAYEAGFTSYDGRGVQLTLRAVRNY